MYAWPFIYPSIVKISVTLSDDALNTFLINSYIDNINKLKKKPWKISAHPPPLYWQKEPHPKTKY